MGTYNSRIIYDSDDNMDSRVVSALIYIAIFIAQLGVKALIDWLYKEYKKKIINHGASVAADGIIYFISAYILFCAPNWCSTLFMVGIMWTSGAMRWILYDSIYNLINKHRYNHLGDSAGLDGLLKRLENKGVSQYIVKGASLVIGIILLTLNF